MTDNIDVFDAACAGEWRRGVRDCFTAASDQLAAWFGVDPMERYRGRYTTLTGYLRIIRKDGYRDAQEAFSGEMEAHGFRETDGPWMDRDVGMIAFPDNGKPATAPALFFEGGWHIRSRTGWLVLFGDDGLQKVYRCPSR